MDKITKAVIPAAGYGTRLYPITLDKPKALVEVAKRPMLQHVIDKIVGIESIDEIVLITNHKFYQNFVEWLNKNPQKIKISILDDQTLSNENRLGAMGDILFGIDKTDIKDGFISVSSDNIFNFDLKRFMDYFDEKQEDVIAVYDVKNINEAKKMGVVFVGSDNSITDFEEKPENPKSTLCSIGIYAFSKDTVRLLDEYAKEGNSLDKQGDFLKWLYKKKKVYAFPYESKGDKWYDIGSMETLNVANKEFENIA